MGDSERSSPKHAESADVPHRFDVDVEVPQGGYSWRNNRCVVCGGLLKIYDRKVHRGACARARKTQLQKLARERRRR